MVFCSDFAVEYGSAVLGSVDVRPVGSNECWCGGGGVGGEGEGSGEWVSHWTTKGDDSILTDLWGQHMHKEMYI